MGKAHQLGSLATPEAYLFDKPKIAAAYAMAAQYMGMRFVYLEAGSGAKQNVTPEMVQTVRAVFDGFIMVGGGIRSAKTASSLIKAGADGLVVGTFVGANRRSKKIHRNGQIHRKINSYWEHNDL